MQWFARRARLPQRDERSSNEQKAASRGEKRQRQGRRTVKKRPTCRVAFWATDVDRQGEISRFLTLNFEIVTIERACRIPVFQGAETGHAVRAIVLPTQALLCSPILGLMLKIQVRLDII